jgi:uncharacterized membrane protein (DUF106 family)
MKEFIATVGILVGAVIVGLAIIAGLTFIGYEGYAFFAPKYRAVDNQVFKESEQYNDGMIRDLENLQMEYMSADKDHKEALRAIVLHRFSLYPEDRMPANLHSFYYQLRNGI